MHTPIWEGLWTPIQTGESERLLVKMVYTSENVRAGTVTLLVHNAHVHLGMALTRRALSHDDIGRDLPTSMLGETHGCKARQDFVAQRLSPAQRHDARQMTFNGLTDHLP